MREVIIVTEGFFKILQIIKYEIMKGVAALKGIWYDTYSVSIAMDPTTNVTILIQSLPNKTRLISDNSFKRDKQRTAYMVSSGALAWWFLNVLNPTEAFHFKQNFTYEFRLGKNNYFFFTKFTYQNSVKVFWLYLRIFPFRLQHNRSIFTQTGSKTP